MYILWAKYPQSDYRVYFVSPTLIVQMDSKFPSSLSVICANIWADWQKLNRRSKSWADSLRNGGGRIHEHFIHLYDFFYRT